MRSEVMKQHGLTRDLPGAGYFETEQQPEVVAEITAAIHSGKLVATVEIDDSVLSADLDALEAMLTRYGYNVRALAESL